MPPIPPFQKHKQPQSPICSKVPDVTRSPVGPFFFQLHWANESKPNSRHMGGEHLHGVRDAALGWSPQHLKIQDFAGDSDPKWVKISFTKLRSAFSIWDLAPVKHNWLWSWRSSEHLVSLAQLSKMDPFWKILHLWSSLSFPCPVLRFIPSISVHYELALTSYYRADPDTHRSSSKNRKWQTLWTNHFESSFSSCPAPARNKSRSPPTMNAHAYHQLPLKLRKQIW